MRVIAGQFRSRPLRSLPGSDTRPTSDRLRETLFDVLAAGNPEALRGSRWLDLYAGTGAVGIEALSRGAAHVLFVDSARAAVAAIRDNLKSLGIGPGADVLHQDAAHALRALSRQDPPAQFDFCFLDPPYRMQQAYSAALEALADSLLLAPGARVIAEHGKRFDPGDRFSALARTRLLKQGDAALSFYSIG